MTLNPEAKKYSFKIALTPNQGLLLDKRVIFVVTRDGNTHNTALHIIHEKNVVVTETGVDKLIESEQPGENVSISSLIFNRFNKRNQRRFDVGENYSVSYNGRLSGDDISLLRISATTKTVLYKILPPNTNFWSYLDNLLSNT